MPHATFTRPPYRISTDPSQLNIPLIHRYLSQEAYWARGRSRETVELAIGNSLNFGLYHETTGQVGFARVVTDGGATFGWLADVFVLPDHQRKGLGKWLMSCIVDFPPLRDLRLFMLGTADAHELYTQFDFQPLSDPKRFMVKRSAGKNS